MANERTAAEWAAEIEEEWTLRPDVAAAVLDALLAYGAQERRGALEEAEAVVLLLAKASKMPGVSAILASNSIRALASDTKAGG